jgi:hypothetical protein
MVSAANPIIVHHRAQAHWNNTMTEEISTTTAASATRLDDNNRTVWQAILSRVVRRKPVGAVCEYCGWRGAKDAVLMSPRLNEDGAVYQITACPSCMRNGGLVFHD